MMHHPGRRYAALLLILFVAGASSCHRPARIWLDGLNMALYNESVSSVTVLRPGGGSLVKIGSRSFSRGIALRPVGVVPLYLQGHASRFTAWVGVEDTVTGDEAMRFFVLGDRKVLFRSPALKGGDGPVRVDVSLKGVQRLGLLVVPVHEGGRRILSWWADASLAMAPADTPARIPNAGKRYILTPPAPPEPRIGGARVAGATAGHPFLWRIAATGKRPMRFAAAGLPAGLSLDTATGIISGSVQHKGDYRVTLVASNGLGADTAKLLLSAEGRLALTPPMGWNGWNAWVKTLDRNKVMASVRALVTTGLINHGWTYVNLDDTWEGPRGGPYNAIQPGGKFPRFRQMVDSVHSLGLKMGVYGTPWICTYAGFPGSTSDNPQGLFSSGISEHKRAYHYIGKYSFEKNDARQMAAWGIDYLKYDWHMRDPAEAATMLGALRSSGRDIVFSLSNHAPLSHAAGWAGTANLYRTGPDIRDSWTSLEVSGFGSGAWAPYGGPGHWNDPDMLVVGDISTGAPLHPTRLTPDEQYTQVSLWCLLAAPLVIGCPLERLDSFTLNLLDNDEVLAVDQDPLGKPAVRISDTAGGQIWARPLQDGSLAVGLFHTGNWGTTPASYFSWGDEQPADIAVSWKQLHIQGKYRIRDLWRQKDLGVSDSGFHRRVPFHGVLLLRLEPAGSAPENKNNL